MKVKLAVIRDNEVNKCPFGLHIPDACLSAGTTVERMTVIKAADPDVGLTESEANVIMEANRRVFAYSVDKPSKCVFANFIFNKEGKTECNHSASGWSIGTANLNNEVTPYQQWGMSFYSIPAGDFGGYRNENLAGQLGMEPGYDPSYRAMGS